MIASPRIRGLPGNDQKPRVKPGLIRHGLEGNLCRCTGYHNIV
jgi:aerobic-type carbon monoxide dehydrogenase small subunit (CoxS/CutS family)